MSEQYMQVPVSLPTTEQIREAYVYTGDGLDFKSAAERRGEEFDRWLASLSQPTPTAEPGYNPGDEYDPSPDELVTLARDIRNGIAPDFDENVASRLEAIASAFWECIRMNKDVNERYRALLSAQTAEQCKAVFPGDFHGPPMYCTAPVNHQGPHDADGMRWLDPSAIRPVTPPA